MGVLAGLSKLINTLAPINQLPPEILGMVPKYQEGQTWKELVKVSGVCAYWRNTFLATPSIWTRLNGRGIEKTRAWVRRSKGLPIQLEAETSPDLQVLKFLAPHFPRLDVAILLCLKARDRSLIEHNHLAKLLRPNPLLRVLHIEASTGLGTFDAPVVVDGEFPSLERLFVTGIQVVFTNLYAPKLRDAHITGTFDLTNLLDFLEASPLLEYLALKLDLQDTTVNARRKVALEKIESLRFFYHGSTILQHLSLPPGSDIKMIEAISPDQLDGTTSAHAHFLSRALDNLPMSRQAESLSFHTTGTDTCRFVSLSGPNGALELLTNEINTPTACVTLLRIFARHSFGSIRDLKITELDLFPRDSELISDFMRSLNGLQSIVMLHTNVSPWLSALGSNHCPQLQDLTFEHPSPWSADYDAFLRFAKDRSAAGVPIQRLRVMGHQEGSLDAVRMEVLREYVRHVVWTRGGVCT